VQKCARGVQRGAKVAVCEGISRGSHPKGRASSVSPRYEIWNKASPPGGLVPFRPGFMSPLEGGYRLCICDAWTASNASTCARHGWAATP
jgi:hypothetical protein